MFWVCYRLRSKHYLWQGVELKTECLHLTGATVLVQRHLKALQKAVVKPLENPLEIYNIAGTPDCNSIQDPLV